MVELSDELLTVREAAAFLKVTPHTIYRWISEDRLPAVRHSRRIIRLRREDLGRVSETPGGSGEEPPKNWAERLAPFFGIMTKEEADAVWQAIDEAREASISDPH